MARAQPEKRAQARRLVEDRGLSLNAAAAELGVGQATVRRWQKADEVAGDPWVLGDLASIAQKERDAARTDEERAALVEKARQAQALLWANRRPGEADAAGVAATATRAQLMNTLPQIGAALIEAGGDADTQGLRAQRLATTARNLAITYGVLLDKADTLSGLRDVATGSGTTVEGDVAVEAGRATVLSILDRAARDVGRRRTG